MEHRYGNNLKSARERRGMTQQQSADSLGVAIATYQAWEWGNRDMRTSALLRVADLFGCSAAYLLGETDIPSYIDSAAVYGHTAPVADQLPWDVTRDQVVQSGVEREVRSDLWDAHRDCLWVPMRGHSLDRLLPEGAWVLLDMALAPRDGDVTLAWVGRSDGALWRYRGGDGVTLLPDSHDAAYQPVVAREGDQDAPKVRVIGRAVYYAAPDGWMD